MSRDRGMALGTASPCCPRLALLRCIGAGRAASSCASTRDHMHQGIGGTNHCIPTCSARRVRAVYYCASQGTICLPRQQQGWVYGGLSAPRLTLHHMTCWLCLKKIWERILVALLHSDSHAAPCLTFSRLRGSATHVMASPLPSFNLAPFTLHPHIAAAPASLGSTSASGALGAV